MGEASSGSQPFIRPHTPRAYPAWEPYPSPMESHDFAQLASARHSVRDFVNRPIDPEVLEAILDDAKWAPSWSNTRPYLIALASGERAKKLCDAYLTLFDEYRAASEAEGDIHERVEPDWDFPVWVRYPDDLRASSVALGRTLYSTLGIARDDQAARDAWTRKNFEAFGAPVIGLIYVHSALLPFSALDAGILFGHLALAAKAHGVDSCALGNLATFRSPGDALFDIPEDYRLITGFALGYASDAPVNEVRAEHPAIRLATPKES